MSRCPETVAAAYLHTTGRVPDKEAVVSADGRRYSYREVTHEVERLATGLMTLGCRPGDRVAVWLANSPEWVFAEFACALLGVLIVPVNARYRSEEAAYVLRSARAKVLITQPRFLSNDYLSRLHEMAGGPLGSGEHAGIANLPDLESIVLTYGDPEPGTCGLDALCNRAQASGIELDPVRLAAARRPEDPAWIFWTSGSTGHPKGAVLPNHCISNIYNWTTLAARIGEEDRILTSFPVFYVGGNFWCILASMVHGATLVMSAEFDAESILKACKEERVTVLSGIPTMLKEFVHDPEYDASAFASVRVGFFGGATMPQRDIVTLVERIGYEHFLQIYGMTELHGISMSTLWSDPRDIQLTTCGRPLPGFEIKLVDDSGAEVTGAGTGEAWFKGRTHLTYEGLTEEELSGFWTEDGWFRTGDVLLRRADGRYEFVTRTKDLIKVGGENVAAAEIERVLKDHPSIFNVQVIGVADEWRSEVPAAFVELRAGEESLALQDLRAWCRERMAPYKIPRRLRILRGDDWPRTQSAKIARYQLEALL